MKKILIASVLLMVGCVTQEEEYTKAVALAESLLIKSEDLGFGFQAGMTKAESDAHLKKNTRHSGINY